MRTSSACHYPNHSSRVQIGGADDDDGRGVATMPGPRTGRRRQDPRPRHASRRPASPRSTREGRSSGAREARPRGPDGRFLQPEPVLEPVPVRETVLAPVTKDSTICAESRELAEFPAEQISELCLHTPGVWLTCIQTSIQLNFSSKRWDQIHCPECRALLDYHHVRKYADEDTFAKQVDPTNLQHHQVVKQFSSNTTQIRGDVPARSGRARSRLRMVPHRLRLRPGPRSWKRPADRDMCAVRAPDLFCTCGSLARGLYLRRLRRLSERSEELQEAGRNRQRKDRAAGAEGAAAPAAAGGG